MRILKGTTLLVVLAMTACQPTGPAGLSDQDREAIKATTQAFEAAMLAADWVALAATYTENAVVMPPNAPAVEGRANIQASFSSFPPISAMELENIEVEGQGSMAFVRGIYRMTLNPPDMAPINDTGKYLEIRLKQADGSWLLHRDIYNSDMPLAP